uniref:Uncharacterized protein n=1 Tax=Denticeps clupeoides TaxID=299321 RepID=A0AAY4CZ29_9TELE
MTKRKEEPAPPASSGWAARTQRQERNRFLLRHPIVCTLVRLCMEGLQARTHSHTHIYTHKKQEGKRRARSRNGEKVCRPTCQDEEKCIKPHQLGPGNARCETCAQPLRRIITA